MSDHKPGEERVVPSRKHQHVSKHTELSACGAEYGVCEEVRALFECGAEVPRANIKGETTTDDLGVDSLMIMEVISELSSHFAIDLSIEGMVESSTVDSLTA